MSMIITPEVSERLDTVLLHFLWQGIVVAVGLAVVRRFTTEAKRQYAASLAAMLLLAACPVVTYILLTANPVTGRLVPSPPKTELQELGPIGASQEMLRTGELRGAPTRQAEASGLPAAAHAGAKTRSLEMTTADGSRKRDLFSLAEVGWERLRSWTVWAWLFGASLLSAYRALGYWMLSRWRRSASAAVPASILRATERLQKALRVWQRVDVLACSRAAAPVVFGVIRPVILLPASLIAGLPPQQLEMLLAHELAHIRRWDTAVNLLQALIETLLFYHPAVWWISRLLREDRERCADDLVLKEFADRRAYAQALASVAGAVPWPDWVPAASSGSLSERIRRILRQPAPRSRTAMPLTMIVVVGLIGGFGALWKPTVLAAEGSIQVAAGASVQEAIDRAPAGGLVKIPAGTFRENLVITKPLTLMGEGWDKCVVVAKFVTSTSREDIVAIEKELRSAANREEAERIWREKLDRPVLKIVNTEKVTIRGLRFGAPPLSKVDGLMPLSLIVCSGAREVLIKDTAVIGPFWDGVHIVENSSVRMEKSLVAGLWGTGVVVEGKQGSTAASRLDLQDCDVRNCFHRGITLGAGCDHSVISHCRISGSAWHGVRYDDASPTIENCAIFENARSGIYASGRTAAKITGNLFYANEMSGVSCWYENNDVLEKNTFAENKREAVSVLGKSQTKIFNNIFYSHAVAVRAGMIGGDSSNSAGQPVLESNWFWRNGEKFASANSAALRGQLETLKRDYGADHPTIQSKLAEIKNSEASLIEKDPGFKNPAGHDFALEKESAAAKAGVGVVSPETLTSPWPLTDAEKTMIPDTSTRDSAKWKKPDASTVVSTKGQATTGGIPEPFASAQVAAEEKAARDRSRYGRGELVSLTFWVPNLQSRQRELANRITRLWGESPEDFMQWSLGGDTVRTLCTSNIASYVQTNLACDITDKISQGELRRIAGILNDLQEMSCRLPEGSEVNLETCQKWLNDSIAAGWAVGVTLRSDRPGHRELVASRRARE